MPKEKRIYWVDNAKAIGILLVLIRHTPLPEKILSFIYSFHIPLFFFLSGIFFKSSNFPDFFRKKYKRLLIPYFVIGLLSILMWIPKKYILELDQDIEFWFPFFGLLYGNVNFIIFNKPIWFLVCLFVVNISFFFIFKIFENSKNKYFLIFGFLLLLAFFGYLYSLYKPLRLPWMMDTALVAVLFFGLGLIYKHKLSKKVFTFTNQQKFTLIFILFVIVVIISILNGRIDMAEIIFNNCFLFLVGSFSGILMIILISELIPKNRIFGYIGKNTMIIFTFHTPVYSIIIFISIYLFKYPITTIYTKLPLINPEANPIFISMVFVLPTLIILIPIIELINRKFPFLIGLEKNKDCK